MKGNFTIEKYRYFCETKRKEILKYPFSSVYICAIESRIFIYSNSTSLTCFYTLLLLKEISTNESMIRYQILFSARYVFMNKYDSQDPGWLYPVRDANSIYEYLREREANLPWTFTWPAISHAALIFEESTFSS